MVVVFDTEPPSFLGNCTILPTILLIPPTLEFDSLISQYSTLLPSALATSFLLALPYQLLPVTLSGRQIENAIQILGTPPSYRSTVESPCASDRYAHAVPGHLADLQNNGFTLYRCQSVSYASDSATNLRNISKRCGTHDPKFSNYKR